MYTITTDSTARKPESKENAMNIRFVNAAAPLTLFAASQVGHAQEKATFIIDVIGGPVSPSNPSVTVKIYAAFPQQYWAFGQTSFDLVSTDSTGAFSDLTKPTGVGALAPGSCAPWNSGVPNSAGGILFISTIQLNLIGCAAFTYNPIQIWEATWTTSNFKPRNVVLTSEEIRYFGVYTWPGSSTPDLNLDPGSIEPGSATLQVVPTPAIGAVFLGGCVLATRRRRF